jgi:FkbM family methyltransferase
MRERIPDGALDVARRVKGRFRHVRNGAEDLTRLRIHSTRSLPRGVDLFVDLGRDLADFKPAVIFDVGANVGLSTAACLARFPKAEIYSFEPVEKTYAQLDQRFAKDPRVRCFHLALGAEATTGTITVSESAVLASLSPTALIGETTLVSGVEQVEVETLDDFTTAHEIDRIDYLKVDTEGYDLNVVKGAERLLDEEAIDLIEVEVGMHSDNTTHVPFEPMRQYLEQKGYSIFGFYDQVEEWTLGRPQLRRANVVFAAASLIAAHDAGPPPGLMAG